ncbi:hypothetical protein C6N75_29720 [Streptomyces solincola]|uniref:Uncharacterized protein n=1 Tax=Streptomyces solincola TaxID=2100817 RepID=A0A2S9PMN8_9ACTN|nr:hypothetical protein C6N75_29720 [Streptomyces solincola]
MPAAAAGVAAAVTATVAAAGASRPSTRAVARVRGRRDARGGAVAASGMEVGGVTQRMTRRTRDGCTCAEPVAVLVTGP